MKNKYPIFIPTKGRYQNPLTIKMFQKHRVDFTIVVEKHEYNEYLKIVDKNNILVLPHQNEGLTKTRNWIWDYAESKGYKNSGHLMIILQGFIAGIITEKYKLQMAHI